MLDILPKILYGFSHLFLLTCQDKSSDYNVTLSSPLFLTNHPTLLHNTFRDTDCIFNETTNQ
jgi:hypothetical protein